MKVSFPPKKVFMYIFCSVPFECLANLLRVKHSNCSWERGVARWAELLSPEKTEKPGTPHARRRVNHIVNDKAVDPVG